MEKITVPTLLLDQQRCLKNIARMAAKAKRNGVELRPHLKTPQSNGVAEWFRDFGIDKIAVSSLRMAKYYAKGGWKDITVAFPLNVLEMDLVNELAEQVQLNVLVESLETLKVLQEKVAYPIGMFIEIDGGYNRTGMAVDNFNAIGQVLSALKPDSKVQFKGFLVHAGHTYKEREKAGIQSIHEQHIKDISALKAQFISQFPDLVVSYGDTPSCSTMEDFSSFDEIRPGNFVFYDLSQYHIGSCELADIAVAMACPVVGLYPERQEIVVYGGGVHFSKDRATTSNGRTYYGRVVEQVDDSWAIPKEESYMKSLSQEHGTIKATNELLAKTKVGDLITVLPIHSCMTVDLMPYYLTLEGKKIDIWNKQ